MDALRILTRATKLSKQVARGNEVGNAQTSKKRKRNSEASWTEFNDNDIDFFKDQSHKHLDIKSLHLKDNKQVNGHASSGKATKNDDDAGDNNGASNLGFAECKHMLKQHKLKITQIWPLEEKSAQKRHSRTENEAKKKKRKLEVTLQPLTSFQQLRSRYNVANRICENLQKQGYTTPTEIQSGSLPLLLDSRNSRVAEGQENSKKMSYDNKGPVVDLLAVAPTGSGKTLAFLIPVLNSLVRTRREDEAADEATGRRKRKSKGPRAIILAPTKELASQIVNEGRKLALNTGIRISLVRKGSEIYLPSDTTLEEDVMSVDSNHSDDDALSSSSSAAAAEEEEEGEEDKEDEEAEAEGGRDDPQVRKATAMKAEVLVSTPLALIHALTSRDDKVQKNTCVQHLILDEADVLLDPLFRAQTMAVWQSCVNSELRITFWSATMGSSIEELALSTLVSSPSRSLRSSILRIVVGLKDSAIPRNIQHKLTYCATEPGKLLALRSLLRPDAPPPSSSSSRRRLDTTTAASAGTTFAGDKGVLRPPFLVFTQTIARAVALHAELLYDIPAQAGGAERLAVLHAGLSESARASVMARFRRGEVWVLITTDLLSRGVDFRGVNGVVNYDFPGSSAAYVHRVGRTGRAGRAGCIAVTLYADEDVPFLKNVTNVLARLTTATTTTTTTSTATTTAAAAAGGATDNTRNDSDSDNENGEGRGGAGDGSVVQLGTWLTDALPKPTRREKQMLKKRGVESRRPTAASSWRNRISTKSGFERRLENRKRGAIAASLNAANAATKENKNNKSRRTATAAADDDDDDEFDEFSD